MGVVDEITPGHAVKPHHDTIGKIEPLERVKIFTRDTMALSKHEALTRFQSARVAHLATVDADGRPHLVPVTFAAWADKVITAVDHKPKSTTNLKRLHNIRTNPQVSVLTDEYDDDWSHLWWVRVDGTAEVIETEPRRSQLVEHLIEKYSQYQDHPPKGPAIQIHIGAVQSWTYK